MITIDGSAGEGGGQILRTSLTLSLITGKPFRLLNVRAKRERPGLRPQHLAAVKAAARVGNGLVEGDSIGSSTVLFQPNAITPGRYEWEIGTAGSVILVAQTVILPLALTEGRSSFTLRGGTHNPKAPTFDYLDHVYLPLLRRMGARVEARLDRPGFYPKGLGAIEVEVEGVSKLEPIELGERGAVRRAHAKAVVASLERSVAQREVARLSRALSRSLTTYEVKELPAIHGPINYLELLIESEEAVEVVTSFGEKGLLAERVADAVAEEANRYLEAGAPVGEHLADQLLLPLALAGGGRFETVKPSSHFETNLAVIGRFLDIETSVAAVGDDRYEVRITRPS